MLALLGIVVSAVVGLAPSELREFFGIESMTFTKVVAGFIYICGCILLWVYAINPLIPTKNQTFLNQNPDQNDKLIFSNMSVVVSPDNIVTLRTVINTFTSGILKPVKSLKPNNFTIQEQLDEKLKAVPAIAVTPMKSASQITILIDASESMWGETEITKKGKKLRKIEVVRESILNFSKKLIKSQSNSVTHSNHLSFLIFSGKGVSFLPNSEGGAWFMATGDSLPEIKTAIESINPLGQTPMFDAISHAIDVLRSESKSMHKLILCLTDGMDNSSDISPEVLREKIQTSGIPIVTIGYGKEEELEVPTLHAISSLSGAGGPDAGSFTNIKPKQLSSVFDLVLNNINNTYEIRWKSSFPIPGKHVLARLQAAYRTALGKKVSPVTELAYTVPSLRN